MSIKAIITIIIMIIAVVVYEWDAFSKLPDMKAFKKEFRYANPLLPLIFIIAMIYFIIYD